MTDLSAPRILPCGDSALTVEFGDTIDAALNARVLALDAQIAAAAHPAILETVPTYRSLMVHYDPVRLGFAQIRDWLDGLGHAEQQNLRPPRRWRIPVVYGGDYGEDIDFLAQTHGMTPGEVVERHQAGLYRVYMLGFTPGFSYLGGLDPKLATPRRESPRLMTPAGTISIGGVQASVQCMAGPSGWHLLGRTPVRTYHPERDPVFLLEPGDEVTFYSIDASHWPELDAAAERGEPVADMIAS